MDGYIENEDQIALRRWLTAGLRIPEVMDLHGDQCEGLSLADPGCVKTHGF